jgi:hypothetical protein
MQIMHFLLNLHYRPMDLSHRVSGTGEPAPAWFVSLTMIWPSVGGKHFINRTGVNQLLLWRWSCLLLPEFMVMWRWENSLQNECSGPTLQMLQVNCYNQTYQCSQAPEWLQSYKRQIEWPLLTSTPYLDIFQYVWELPYHAHDWHILSAWQLRRPYCMWASCQMISKLPVPSSNLWHLNKSNCPIETWELEPQRMICSWCLLPSIAPPETHTSKALTKIARSKFWLSCTMQPVEDENHVSGNNEVDDHPQEKLWPSMICCDQTSLIPS